MKLTMFSRGGVPRLGSVTPMGVLDIPRASEAIGERTPGTIWDALKDWGPSLSKLERAEETVLTRKDLANFLTDTSEAKFHPPLSTPQKILCVFINYRSHGKEVGSAPSEPVFFFKHSNCIVGDGEEVVIPRFSKKADHEVELGVIIGRRGKDVEPSKAYDYVAGYTVLNDISFRDGMFRGVEGTVLGRNLYKGKVADTALPMGPLLITRDELPDPYPLRLSLRVNGETRQEGTTNDMIFKIPELIASASDGNTLEPGDVIATGTCSGVGLYTGKYLNDGDTMEAEVEKVGVIRNRVRIIGGQR